jgi:hypothetical protein
MVSMADALGMQDYHTLYDDGVNAALKGTRPNPNQLLIGDDVKDPPAKGKVFPKPVDKTHKFVLKAKKPPKLRIVIVDADDKPVKGKAWKLTAPKALTGTTKGNGLIEVPDLGFQDKSGTLEVTWRTTHPPKAAAAAAPPALTKPKYPRPIMVSEFKDDPPKAPVAADDVITFTLKIGSLPTFNDDKGVRARLHNLGYPCLVDSEATITKKAVTAFQKGRLKQKTPSGVAADVQTDVRDKHDHL